MQRHIGENENKQSKSFKRRARNKPGYTLSPCPDLGRKYEWAELKSSFVVKELVHDVDVQEELVGFWQQNIRQLYTFLGVDLDSEFDEYLSEIPTSRQKDKVESYPVGQIKAWVSPAVGFLPASIDKAGAWNNFFVLFNFIKWTWYKLKYREFYNKDSCPKRPVYAWLLIDLFQQKVLIFHDMIRGDRLNLNHGEGGPANNQIGITNLYNSRLKRMVRNKVLYDSQAWDHPGQVQCRVPYRGKYGTYMKQYLQEDSFYASLQCGISGSVQYAIFMYLLSTLPVIPERNIGADIRNLVISAVLILTGDGGHNIREVVFGFTCTVIIMYHLLNLIKIEVGEFKKHKTLGPFLTAISKYIQAQLPSFACIRDIDGEKVYLEVFNTLIDSILDKWKPIIDRAYQITAGINIVGVYTSDLNNFDPSILKDPAKSLQKAKEWMVSQIFALMKNPSSYNLHTETNYELVQIFFALENNRYLLNPKSSFKRAANDFMTRLVNSFPQSARSNIFGKVNTEMLATLMMCEKDKQIDPTLHKKIKGDASNIPMASPRRAGCSSCESDAEVVIDDEDGYCIDCASNTL